MSKKVLVKKPTAVQNKLAEKVDESILRVLSGATKPDVLSVDKTHGHNITMIPIEKIMPNDYNPNTMTAQLFDNLADDMETIGVLSAILVYLREDGMYEIIDGEHRFEVMKLKDMAEIPCIVVEGNLKKDRDARIFQTMRMNKLRGQTDYKKLKNVVQELSKTHDLGEIASKLLFTDANQLASLIDEVRTTLPNEQMQKEFDKAKGELKTVDDLTALIKRLFTTYGADLRFHMMMLDYGGKDCIWIRLRDRKMYRQLCDKVLLCRQYNVTADSVIMSVLLKYMTVDYFKKNLSEFDPADEDDSLLPDTDNDSIENFFEEGSDV